MCSQPYQYSRGDKLRLYLQELDSSNYKRMDNNKKELAMYH